MNEEWLEELLRLKDLGAQEDDVASNFALAARLRGATPTGRNDIGSNIGRAAYGISGALGDYRGLTGQAGLPSARNELLAAFLRRRKPGVGVSDPSYDPHMGQGDY